MPESAVYIGVVSHSGTRFPASQSDLGLGSQLARYLDNLGMSASAEIDTENRWGGGKEKLGPRNVQEALSAQVRLEDRWIRFLRAGGRRSFREVIESGLRWTRRGIRRFFAPPETSIVRLLNIELTHIALLEAGIQSEAAWIVILEDDAATSDLNDLSVGLHHLLKNCDSSVNFINLSESFTLDRLDAQRLFMQSNLEWQGRTPRMIVKTQLPLTNTVCAIAYRASFAESLLNEYRTMTLHPVIPIDWKLNQALMNMYERGELPTGSCSWIVPGPIDQLSMRENA